uniref:Hipothetical protein n=1 Tax=Culex tarsalis TaxID=7177 RepID=A0A1Q3EZ09_CULTA
MVVKMIENPRAGKKLKNGKPPNGSKRTRVQRPPVETEPEPVAVAQAEEKSILVAKELKFVKSLAGNDPKLRRKVLKNLKIWLNTRSRSSFAFTDADFLRLWKGLFYCMWMSDKPLIQENLADEIASLVQCFEDLSIALQYFGAFLETMSIEWFGIDNWRIDKFMMLVRRCTRQMLIMLHEAEWPKQQVETLMKYVDQFLLNSEKCPFGLTKHFGDLLLEEVAKVSEGDIDQEIVHTIVETYAIRLLSTNDMRLIKHITSSVFHSLLYQSELGQDYQEKFDLWKKTNFVTGNIDSVDYEVNCEYEDDEDVDQDGGSDEEGQAERVFDPRAGQVDVVINELHFDPLKIVEIFEANRFKPFVSNKGRKHMKMLVKQYKKFATGVFPLGIQTVDSIDKKDYKVDIEEQIEELENFERELVGEKPGKKKKKKVEANSLEESHTQTDKTETDSPTKGTKKPKKKKPSKKDVKQQKLLLLKAKRDKKLEALKERKQAKSAPVNPSSSTKSSVKAVSETKFASAAATNGTFKIADEWSEPLKDGETEQFIPSRKAKLKQIKKQLADEEQTTLVRNPFATPKNNAKTLKRVAETPQTDGGIGGVAAKKKRVKIALNKNISQDLKEHINQVLSSPQVPYDSSKKPSKGALKPNLMPSPINPFYRKKIGLKLNDTL